MDIPDAVIDLACVDRDTCYVDSKGLGSLTVFNLVCSLGYGKVIYQSMPALLLLLELCPGESFVNLGTGIGYFLHYLAMVHPHWHSTGWRWWRPDTTLQLRLG